MARTAAARAAFIAILLLGIGAAEARVRERFAFRLHLGSGRVQVTKPAQETSALARLSWFAVFGTQGRLIVTEVRVGKPNRSVFEIAAPTASGLVAWQREHGKKLIFAWRSFASGGGDSARHGGPFNQSIDWVGAVEPGTRRVSWSRELTEPMSSQAVPLGDSVMLLPTLRVLELIDVATGQTLRRQSRYGDAVGGWLVEKGAALVSDGASLELLDVSRLTTLWRVVIAGVYSRAIPVDEAGTCATPAKTSASERPLRRDVDWLVYGAGVLARIDSITGQPRYEVPSRASGQPCVFEDRIYEPEIDSTDVSVVARSLSSGAVLRRYHVQSYAYADEKYVRVTHASK